MTTPYIGEIRMFAGSFAPAGWAFCDGQAIPISENDALFQVIGTTYGGDGEETFNLPNLQSRVAMHSGNGHIVGEAGGAESVTLSTQQIPIHSHAPVASSDPASVKGATGGVLGRAPAEAYASEFTPELLSPQSISPVGGSQPHENMQPFLVISFIISLFGLFPSPN
ncbi:MAG TPA: tail fiber protein [Croceibacterium sp.]|nr:tail fiber protein [Croceibacterium sp.]